MWPLQHRPRVCLPRRPRFSSEVYCSKDIPQLGDSVEITTAGLVIRRQRPLGKAVFIMLEDEFGHIPLIVFSQVCERHYHKFRSSFLVVKGRLSRREGTHQVVVYGVRLFSALDKGPGFEGLEITVA